MKTSVELDASKVEIAKKLSKSSTLRELLDYALDALIAQSRRQAMDDLLGTDFFEGDINKMRGRNERTGDSSVWIDSSKPKENRGKSYLQS